MPKITHSALNPSFQADAILNQAAPVQNTWYTILDTTINAILHGVTFAIITTDETLEVKITIDGNSYTASQAATASTTYQAYFAADYTGKYLTTVADTISPILWRKIGISCRSLKVEIRKTTATGAGNLRAAVTYSKW